MKSLSIKWVAILLCFYIFMLPDHARAEWRRLRESSKGEAEKEGALQMNKANKKKCSWKYLCENDWGKSFYDPEEITSIMQKTSGV